VVEIEFIAGSSRNGCFESVPHCTLCNLDQKPVMAPKKLVFSFKKEQEQADQEQAVTAERISLRGKSSCLTGPRRQNDEGRIPVFGIVLE
jgi:hypothetical protein